MDLKQQEQEVVVEGEEQAQEQLSQEQQDEEAAFAAQFGEVRGDEPPAGNEEEAAGESDSANGEEGDPQGGQEGKPQGEAGAQSQEEEPIIFAGMTERQLKEQLDKIPKLEEMTAKESQKMFGKLGEVNRTLQALQKSGGRAKLNLAKEQFARLNEDYPELAEALVEGLNGIELDGGGNVSDEILKPIIDERVGSIKSDLQREMGVNLLKIQHGQNFQGLMYEQETVEKDGKRYLQPKTDETGKLVRKPEFASWLKTLPEQEQQAFENSMDPVYVSEGLTKFKSWTASKQQSSQQRQNRLKNAVGPKTTGTVQKPAPATEEEGFLSVFK